ncbi:MAG TPA: DUF4136 domain-containing protein [Gammaproteobacteria bacterium]
MNTLNKSLLILLITQFTACTAPAAKIYSDRNPDIDISGATTFAWLKDEYLLVSSEESNPIVAAKVAKAIEFEMRKKGYVLVKDPETADLAVAFTVGSREEVDIRSFPVTYGGGFRWGGPYYGGSSVYVGTETRAVTYTKGRLAIDVFHVASRQPVWHGLATKTITSSDEKNMDELIKDTVERILAKF